MWHGKQFREKNRQTALSHALKLEPTLRNPIARHAGGTTKSSQMQKAKFNGLRPFQFSSLSVFSSPSASSCYSGSSHCPE
jgi:hypothetical protein